MKRPPRSNGSVFLAGLPDHQAVGADRAQEPAVLLCFAAQRKGGYITLDDCFAGAGVERPSG